MQIIQTLTPSDTVAILNFDSNVNVKATTNNGFTFEATDENKATLIESIKTILWATGQNVDYAFSEAFNIVEDPFANERIRKHNSAILKFTDGDIITLKLLSLAL